VFEHGWSPPRQETLGGESRMVRCLTPEDRRRLYNYIYLLEFEAER
jgi:hypothetical protein